MCCDPPAVDRLPPPVAAIRRRGRRRRARLVAVTAGVPRDDPPPARREERCEDVEGAGEVHAAVGQEQRRTPLVAPLVHGDAEARCVDRALAVGAAGAEVEFTFEITPQGEFRVTELKPRAGAK